MALRCGDGRASAAGVSEVGTGEMGRSKASDAAALWTADKTADGAGGALRHLAAALERMPFGVIVVNEQAEALAMNAYAASLLSAGDGLRLSDHRLVASSTRDTTALHELIRNAMAEGGGGPRRRDGAMTISRAIMGRPISLLVTAPESPPGRPGAAETAESRSAAVIYLSDPERRIALRSSVLARLYDLTPAEIRLVEGLVNGKDLSELSAETGVSRNTLRSQLQAVFSKTHTNRQAQVVRLVLSGPAVLGRGGPP